MGKTYTKERMTNGKNGERQRQQRQYQERDADNIIADLKRRVVGTPVSNSQESYSDYSDYNG